MPAAAAANGESGTATAGTAGPQDAPSIQSAASGALREALDAFDEPAAQAVLDRLLSDLSVAAVLRTVVLPYLTELGKRWEQGTASVAQEHFASNVIRGRLAGLARGWGTGHGPRAVLACPPGELHDLALMAFGIVLNRNGWRIDYLGMSTPVAELAQTVDAMHPDLVVLAATVPENLDGLVPQLTALARRAPLALAEPAPHRNSRRPWAPGCWPATRSPRQRRSGGRDERARYSGSGTARWGRQANGRDLGREQETGSGWPGHHGCAARSWCSSRS